MTEILDQSQFDIKIKWPNDILVNEKKIAGILIENIVNNSTLQCSIIGIGINVRQGEFDEKINATSLQILTKKDHDLNEALKLLCSRLEKYYLMLRNGNHQSLSEAYLSRFYGLNEWRVFETGLNRTEKLFVKGVSKKGMLALEDIAGQVREFDMKEIKWRLR
jgi:BirA family biotin operon repressor/biotin-[acetyl-CoA-carboxylase] ligase